MSSTVDSMGKTAYNRDKFNSWMNWVKSLVFGKRYTTMKSIIRLALQSALTGFAPGVFLIMTITVLLDGIRFFIRNRTWEMFIDNSLRNPNFWQIVVLELLLLTGGYVITTSIINPKYLSFAWSRIVIAGVGAVILLGILSIFTQGASLPMLASASLGAGMISVLFLLHKMPKRIGD